MVDAINLLLMIMFTFLTRPRKVFDQILCALTIVCVVPVVTLAQDIIVTVRTEAMDNRGLPGILTKYFPEGSTEPIAEEYSQDDYNARLNIGTLDIAVESGGITLKYSIENAGRNPTYGPMSTRVRNPSNTGNVRISDIRGAEVQTIPLDKGPGQYLVDFGGLDKQGKPLASGIYIATLITNFEGRTITESTKFVVLKNSSGYSGINATMEIPFYETTANSLGRDTRGMDMITFEGDGIDSDTLYLETPNESVNLTKQLNMHPRILSQIPEDQIEEGEFSEVNVNNHVDNDQQSLYEVTNQAFSVTDSIVALEDAVAGEYETWIRIIDSVNPSIKDSLLYRVFVDVAEHTPVVSVEGYVGSSNELVTAPQTHNLGTVAVTDADEGDVHSLSIVNQTQLENVLVYLEGNQLKMTVSSDSLNGEVYFGIRAEDQTGLADTLELVHSIAAQPDVTLKLRDLTRAGMPVYDGIESTFQIGENEYTSMNGQITLQLQAGETYEIWGENDSTGVFNEGVKIADSYIAIRDSGAQWLVDENLEQRVFFGDQSSALTFDGEDKVLDLFKFGIIYTDIVKLRTIINSWDPLGTDKPNTLTPDAWIDTTDANYGTPDSASYEHARFTIEEFIPEIMSEFGFAPVWRGYGTPPAPDPNGTTFYTYEYRTNINPPGFGIPYVNPTNDLYQAKILLSANHTNTAVYTIIETIQAGLGMVGDPGDDGGIIDDILEYTDEQGIPHFNQLFYTTLRTWVVFDKGSNI